jgi:hypothetical protein
VVAVKPQAAHVLSVLRDREPHSAIEFKRGRHGVYVDAVSQRVGELRALGYHIDGGRAGHAVATYRLTSEPSLVPAVETFGGALFDLEGVRS